MNVEAKNKINNFNAIAISIASPEDILSWSHGEVKKPETINYRTQKPERDGLFCERIFGPTKNWECYCGKYKRIRYKGVICEKCGVEVTRSIVRRERMGHIKLAAPVTHIWFLRSTPSRIGLLLDLPIKTMEQVAYFAAYIVTHADEKGKEETLEQLKEEFSTHRQNIQKELKEEKSRLSKEGKGAKELDQVEKEYAIKIDELRDQYNQAKEDLENLKICSVLSELEYRDMSMKFGHIFKAGTGAEAIRTIIENTDLKKLIENLKKETKKAPTQKQKKIIKRMRLAGGFLKAGIKPEWMVITALPVIPPDLRPMVQLDGGRFAASDLNDLYRRVINRNNRLKKLIAIGAPEVICRNEKRMLQEAVDTLLNNSARQGKAVFTSGDKRKLRSLSDMLKGKQGRFRQNLLGKRVDYSGRSVIVVGPQLQLHQCGLPKQMALELFKPHVIGRLIREGYAHNLKNAEKLINIGKKEVWDILEEITKTHFVLLNRAPTLHRLGIQAFQPILIEGKAIQVHPLVCAAFNADFDGDQMAVHVPLSDQAQKECQELMLSTQNLLKPSAGEPITTATQDMVLGCYYLTKINKGLKGENMVFVDFDEAMRAYQMGFAHLQAQIKCRIKGEIIETSIGRLIFNTVIPEELGFRNEVINKKVLKDLIAECFELLGNNITTQLTDKVKDLGFYYATVSGLSIASSDMIIPAAKVKIIEEASERAKEINSQFWKGFVTDEERYINTIKIWSEAKSKITSAMIDSIQENNDIFYMIDSGARGNWGQITQLCGIKGLVANPAGRTIELPVKSNLKEGFTILEYFIATHGGRKGKSDTALKTAEAGYLTRRLVDAVQDIIIKDDDCRSEHMHEINKKESLLIGEEFENRIFGRTLVSNIIDPKSKEIIAKKGEEIDQKIIKKIRKNKIEEVGVRSVMMCKAKGGVCRKCYGKDLGTNKTVELGTAVGIIAAQSIGEPGTQLTMRTFHMGGVADEADITQGLTRVEELFEARPPKTAAVLAEIKGKIKINRKTDQVEVVLTSEKALDVTQNIPPDFEVTIKEGEKVNEKDVIAKSSETKKVLRAIIPGKIKKVEKNSILITSTGPVEKYYKIPYKRTLRVKNGDEVFPGMPLTIGHINLKELMELTNIYEVQRYIVTEVQSIYASQGQSINDKHIEIIARQMVSKSRILDAGDGDYLPGDVANVIDIEEKNEQIRKKKGKEIRYERLLLGLTRIALQTNSWLAAASFQETIRVLVEAASTRKIDFLEGLKENVIIGKLIPAGEIYRRKAQENNQES
ncbi:DNA-directed RNA polymerase subunit beta' [Candidatus Peregrinibacteria bacterium]|nr:DNA-directed RNA polymerase subunit beta' [Candidatus Peregrinibacteria bacterium]